MSGATIVTGALAAITVELRAWPESPLSHIVRNTIVRPLALQLARLHRGHWLLTLGTLGGVALLIAVLGRDAPMVIAMGAPDLLTWMSLVDLALVTDALVIAASTALVVAATGGKHRVLRQRRTAETTATVRRRSAPRRRRVHAVVLKPANDDGADCIAA